VTFAKKCFSVLHGVSHLQNCFLFLKVDLQKNVFYTFAKMFFAEMISALGVRKKKRRFFLTNFLLDAPQGTGETPYLPHQTPHKLQEIAQVPQGEVHVPHRGELLVSVLSPDHEMRGHENIRQHGIAITGL
jgi:hypothetical protein